MQRTREFIGNPLASNAASIRQHTAEIGELYKGPLVSIEKLTQAHNDLIEAINLVDRLKTEGIEATRSNIIELNKLSSDLHRRTQVLPELKQAPSPEA